MNEATVGDGFNAFELESAAGKRNLQDLSALVNAHGLVILLDDEGKFAEVNDQFVELSGYSRADLMGRSIDIIRSENCAPEVFEGLWRAMRDGEIWRGELCSRAKDGAEFWVAMTAIPQFDAHGKLERLISLGDDITQERQTQEQVRQIAFSDPLTKLPNRSAMLKRMTECMEMMPAGYCAFIAVSLDDLSTVNDVFGYEKGDQLLMYGAKRLAEMPGVTGALGRIDSSVFGLMVEDLGSDHEAAEAQAEHLALQAVEVLSGTVNLGRGVVIEAAASAGYLLCHPGAYGLDAADALKNADIARKRASALGSSKVRAFTDQMVVDAKERVKTILNLRYGIVTGELRLFLQPIVDSDRQVVSFEGLVRWDDPVRGLVMPDQFIGLAETTGMINDLGDWVLTQASKILQIWGEREETQHLTLSINVSEKQLRSPAFVERVRELKGAPDSRIDRLRVEITESILSVNLDRTVEYLNQLRDLGLEIYLDDFGTGYSSLSYLKRLPVHVVKIDRSFVAQIIDDPDQALIVQSIVGLTRILGLEVIAEGVETEEQFQMLNRLGVGRFQGYYFARPELLDPAGSLPKSL